MQIKTESNNVTFILSSYSFHTKPIDEFTTQLNSEVSNITQAHDFLRSSKMSLGELTAYLIAKLTIAIELMSKAKIVIQFTEENLEFYDSKISFIKNSLEQIQKQTQTNFEIWLQKAFHQLANLRGFFNNALELVRETTHPHDVLSYFSQMDTFLESAMNVIVTQTSKQSTRAFAFKA